jgi:hypothetical protein
MRGGYILIGTKGGARMTLKPAVTVVLLLLAGAAAVSACQPATPTPVPLIPTPTMIDAVFYHDNSADGRTSFAYVKCYGNGRATHVTISLDPPNTGTALEVYNDIAVHWLEYPPPDPAFSGTYTLRVPEMSLVLISNWDTQYWSGTYTSDRITVTGSDGVPVEYLLLPLP